MKTTNIYIPRFPGFYESYLSEIIDRNFEDEDGDYSEEIEDRFWEENERDSIYNSIGEAYYDIFKDKYSKQCEEIGIILGDYSKIISPAYYNYGNDELELEVEYDLEKVIHYLQNEKEKWSVYLKDNNTSYDGFSAFGENTLEGFFSKVNSTESLESFEITQVLDFLIGIEKEGEEEDFWESIEGELYSNFSF